MTLTMPEIDFDQIKKHVQNVAYVVTAILIAAVLFESLVMRTFNLALLEALTRLMQLF